MYSPGPGLGYKVLILNGNLWGYFFFSSLNILLCQSETAIFLFISFLYFFIISSKNPSVSYVSGPTITLSPIPGAFK